MESFDLLSLERIFREVDVGCYSEQTPLERFPELATGPTLNHRELLRVANWRNNLTALSQHYNLYFTAVRDRIHATVPRNLKQILPGRPDLEIELPISAESLIVGGHIDPDNPHFINHLIVGEIGGREMVLVSCDDGDVVGYWTRSVYEAITAICTKIQALGNDISKMARQATASVFKTINKECEVKSMFHENVQKSAWGLAIHSQSCLIAVSTNLSEVHIFGFAKRRHPEDVDLEEQSEKIERAIQGVKSWFPRCNQANEFPNSAFDHREHGYRFVLHLRTQANHPTVAFASDCSGEAALILAADTDGVMWMVQLWSREIEYYPRKPFVDPAGAMAWGILVLDVKAFRIEASPHEAIGMQDLSQTLAHVRDPEDIEPDLIYLNNSGQIYEIRDQPRLLKHSTLGKNEENPNIQKERHIFHELMNMAPSQLFQVHDWDSFQSAAISSSYTREHHASARYNEGAFDLNLPDGSALLRTYAYDIELIPPTRGILSTIMKRAIFHPLRSMPSRAMRINRLNLLFAIPPLSLVVIGSQSGDVALITLTRLPNGYSEFGPVTTFRLDFILPFERHIPGNRWPLLGLAVSPVQGNKTKDRWRIILHYMDHTVISYEVWRGGSGDVMVI